MASAATLLPGQQPLAAAGEIVQPNINIPSTSTNVSNWDSSGSIGPFFGVVSVVAVLAILSCILGRLCTGGGGGGRAVAGSPLDNIKIRGYPRWMKRRGNWWCRGGRGGDVEVGANKVIALGHEQEKQVDDDKAKDVEVDPSQLP